MFCPKCGAQNPDGSKFCANCGADCTQSGGNSANTQYNYGSSQVYQSTPINRMGVEERNIAVCIILSFVTCGIYLYYWLYCLHTESKILSGDNESPSGGITILLCIVTCGIYTLYWMYKQGERIDRANVARGKASASNGVLYLVLAIVGLGIVSYALMQNEINKIVRGE